jgi:hypothetical protein
MTSVLAMGLLLGAGTAQAQTTVELDASGNVLRILNLEIFDDQQNESMTYDVDFVNDTANSLYPENSDVPFTTEPETLNALAQVLDALNGNPPVAVL